MSAKHTPGPWDYFVGNANGRGLIRVETAASAATAGVHVASLARGGNSEANARLIAAAPELLEALENMVGTGAQFEDYCDDSEHDAESRCVFCIARAAIAKVEGK